MGRALFLLLYLAGGIAAVAAQTAIDPASEEPMIGASGAIAATLGAYLVLFPGARIQSLVFFGFFYQLVAVPAAIVLGFWFILQLIDGFVSLGATDEVASNVAFFAHIGGFLAGVLIAIPFRLRDRRLSRVEVG
jgi:membrane associated rhomboid family serine protease